jgi:hypothetical protein
MPRALKSKNKKKMFQVVVVAGVSLTACSSGVALPGDGGTDPQPGPTTTNPPGMPFDSGKADADSGVVGPTDARGDEMPIIK